MNTATPFDPWDRLGIVKGGFYRCHDEDILSVVEAVRDGEELENSAYVALICVFLCNTDDFEFDEDPLQIRYVGDDIQKLIDQWDDWYGRHYK